MDKIIKRVLEEIEKKSEDGILLNNDNEMFSIKAENFHRIKHVGTEKKIAFVDGGNLEIIKSPSISLFFNRIYYTIYKNNKRLDKKRIEFYSFIYTKNDKGKIVYSTEYFFTSGNVDLEQYEFDSFDPRLTTKNKRSSPSFIGNVIRRFAELKIIERIDSDIIVLDGSLDISYPHEKKIMNSINKIVCGLSKTSELITRKGDSVGSCLLRNADLEEWYYDTGNNRNFFVKLHPKSRYVFRLDLLQHTYVDEIVLLLKENSKDPVFLGYPYGLIEADRFARVSKEEQATLKMLIQTKFKKDIEKITPYLNLTNAHDVLDNIG